MPLPPKPVVKKLLKKKSPEQIGASSSYQGSPDIIRARNKPATNGERRLTSEEVLNTLRGGTVNLTPTMNNNIKAHASDEITLNDLQASVCQAATQDERFNTDPESDSVIATCPVWCCDILRDEDEDAWSAVVAACDGKMYKVPFTIDEDDGSVELGGEATIVQRRTNYVEAIGRSYCFNGEVVKAGAPKGNRNAAKDHVTELVEKHGLKSVETIGNEERAYEGKVGEANVRVSDYGDFQNVHAGFGKEKRIWENKTPISEHGRVEAISGGENSDGTHHWSISGIAPKGRTAVHHSSVDTDDIITHISGMRGSVSSGKTHEKDFSSGAWNKASNSSIADSLHASGSPSGANQGHANRKSNLASDLSQTAHEASVAAHDSDDEDDHNAAKEAHEQAAESHYEAMLHHGKIGNDDQAKDHGNAMSAHNACADAHCRGNGEILEAHMKVVAEIVKAGGPGSGPRPGSGEGTKVSKGGGIVPENLTRKASLSSMEADNESESAQFGGAAKDHVNAADAHLNAYNDHRIAAKKATDGYEGARHNAKASYHQTMAHFHNEQAKSLGASDKSATNSIKASSDFLHCRASGVSISTPKPWEQGAEVSLCYMPAGISTITAGFRDKAINITVEVDEDTANTVQASFDNLISEAPKQKPFADIEHKEHEASLHPVGFRWGSHDETDGVLMTAVPTALGAHNVNGKMHRSWSPSFATDADYSKAKERGGVMYFPEGVRGSTSNPARITGIDFCVGTLTNKPAFRNMPPVHAKAARIVTAGGPGSGPHAGQQNANYLSKETERLGTLESHQAAAKAHKEVGDKMAAEMNNGADRHYEKMAYHNGKASLLKSSHKLTSAEVLKAIQGSDTNADANIGVLNTATDGKITHENGTGEVRQMGRKHMAKTSHKANGDETSFHDSEEDAVKACNDRLKAKAKKLSTETVLAQLRQSGVPTT